MAVVLAFLAIGAILGVVLFADDRFINGLFGVLIGTLFGLFIAWEIGFFLPIKQVEHIINIVSFGDNLGISGRFFLGTGVVDSEVVYVYYTKTDEGAFQANTLEADEAKVFEDETLEDQGQLRYFTAEPTEDWRWKWLALSDHSERDRPLEYCFYIPKGSFKGDFSFGD